MKILFTKKVDIDAVSDTLGDGFLCDFQEVIAFSIKKIKPFSLENKMLIFTSVNGVKSFFENNLVIKKNKIFVVGNKTEKALNDFGVLVEKSFAYAKDLADFLKNKNDDILHFCGNLSLDIFNENTHYQKIITYETHLIYPKIKEKYDAVVFFSPSGVRSFARHNSLENIQTFAIGKTTEKELKSYTDRIITTQKVNLEGILNEILSYNKVIKNYKL